MTKKIEDLTPAELEELLFIERTYTAEAKEADLQAETKRKEWGKAIADLEKKLNKAYTDFTEDELKTLEPYKEATIEAASKASAIHKQIMIKKHMIISPDEPLVLGMPGAVAQQIEPPINLYRTKAKALDDGALDEAPNNIALLTNPVYQWGMSLYQDGGAHLQLVTSTDGLKFKNGKMYFADMQEVSEVELQNMKTKEGIEEIDLMTLRIFYSVILKKFEENNYKILDDVITMYVPDLAECMGLQRNLNKAKVMALLAKVQSFHNIIGVLHGTRNGKPSQSFYAVLNFDEYDEKNNTITFNSPYMNYLIRTVTGIAVRKDKQGKPKLKKNGEPMRLATHSYLIDTSISKEKNKAAAENVAIIVALIEQAGNNIPRIKASTIVERNVQLQKRIEDDPAHAAQILKRTFTKTWELLQTKTRLNEVYKDIKLPDPKDPAAIPTKSTLNNSVYSFPHNGKK